MSNKRVAWLILADLFITWAFIAGLYHLGAGYWALLVLPYTIWCYFMAVVRLAYRPKDRGAI